MPHASLNIASLLKLTAEEGGNRAGTRDFVRKTRVTRRGIPNATTGHGSGLDHATHHALPPFALLLPGFESTFWRAAWKGAFSMNGTTPRPSPSYKSA